MNVAFLDLRPVKNFAPAEKHALPVSVTSHLDGTPMVVSRYGDDIWDFYPYMPQENLAASHKIIDWRCSLPDGRLLTDPEHSDLLISAKDFVWSLFAQPIEGRKRPTMRTLLSKMHALCPLLKWMVASGLHRFADLAGRTMDYVPFTRLREDGREAAGQTVVCLLLVVEDLHHQREKLNDSLSVHPWPHETAVSLAGLKRITAHHVPKTEVIPDAIASKLATVAIEYIRAKATRILRASEAVSEISDEKYASGCVKQALTDARTALARTFGFDGATELSSEWTRLRTACYILIDMFSGIRDSEMMSLSENCVAAGKSKDGGMDVWWLCGTIYKTGIRPKRWLVPPIVAEAVGVLTRLTARSRRILKEERKELEARVRNAPANDTLALVKRLDAVRKTQDKLFVSRPSHEGVRLVNVLSNVTMRYELRRFCADHGILGPDGQPYQLHAHQFRRTYARFIARSELGDLLTLRDHFGHWSIDMTVFYADGGADEYEADAELLDMITEEKAARQKEIVGHYLDSDTPLANGAHWLTQWRGTVRTATNKEELIAEYAGTITLNGTGHSWCVGNARGTGCGGLCIFEAQMCVDCNYGIIGQEHRPVWEGIRGQQLEALALDDIGPGGRKRAQQILEYADKVLRRLDGQEQT